LLVFAAFWASFAPAWAASMPVGVSFDGASAGALTRTSALEYQTGVAKYKAAEYKVAPGVAPVGPKNRVWDFFADYAKTHRETLSQVAGKHQEKPGFGYETASGRSEGSNSDPASLHKYNYANANPVNGIDPSGYFTLSELLTVQFVQKTLNGMATVSRVKQINQIRKTLCGPIDNAIWEAHHLVPLFMGGAGSRDGSRGKDLKDGWTMAMDPKAHRGLHGIIRILLKFSGLPGSNTKAELWDEALGEKDATPEDAMQVLLDAARIADIVCVATKDYKKVTPRLKKSLRKQGYKVRGNKVIGSNVSYFDGD
jgi:hypothetical protein